MSGSLQEVQLLLLGVPVSADALEATGSVMEGVRHQAQLDVVVPAKLTLIEHPGVRVGRALFGRRLRLRFHTHLATSLSGACTAPPASERIANVSLYGIVADLRRKYPRPAATETLDLVVAELGRTRDNLREAVANLSSKPLPPGGKPVLDEGTLGIGALLVVSSLLGIVLAGVAVYIGVNAILNTSG